MVEGLGLAGIPILVADLGSAHVFLLPVFHEGGLEKPIIFYTPPQLQHPENNDHLIESILCSNDIHPSADPLPK